MPIPIGASRAESAAGAAAVLGWKVIDYPTFVMNIAWEILPTVALLHFFRSIPRSRDNLLRNMTRFCLDVRIMLQYRPCCRHPHQTADRKC